MSHQTKTYLKALAQIREPGRIHHTGTTCSNCGTHFMPNPEKQTTWCGLCKCKRLKASLEATFANRFNNDWTAQHETSLLEKMVANRGVKNSQDEL